MPNGQVFVFGCFSVKQNGKIAQCPLTSLTIDVKTIAGGVVTVEAISALLSEEIKINSTTHFCEPIYSMMKSMSYCCSSYYFCMQNFHVTCPSCFCERVYLYCPNYGVVSWLVNIFHDARPCTVAFLLKLQYESIRWRTDSNKPSIKIPFSTYSSYILLHQNT